MRKEGSKARLQLKEIIFGKTLTHRIKKGFPLYSYVTLLSPF